MKYKHLTILIILLLFTTLQAQQTISGTFSPAEDYTWLIAYRLKPGSQAYVVDTSIKDGKFVLNMPDNTPKGIYRLVYAVPQEEFYFDVIYNGTEDITLDFDSENGVVFKNSKENRYFSSYFKSIEGLEKRFIDYYKNKTEDEKLYMQIAAELRQTQKAYEKLSKGGIVNHFIKANKPYMPAGIESIEAYQANKKSAYFYALDFKDTVLQASSFLTDKVLNYVITALPLKQLSQEDTEIELQKNIEKVSEYLQDVNSTFSTTVYYNLWLQLSGSKYNTASDFLYNNYLKSLAKETYQNQLLEDIETHNRLRIGAVAPEITWKEVKKTKKLSTLDNSDNYLLIFWSSTCSHCLRELPKLQKQLKDNDAIKVIAVGLEDDDYYWKVETPKLASFTHVMALGKWESDYAKTYAIKQTPSYFVLDEDKKIIAKPEDQEEVLAFLEEKKLTKN